MALDISGKTALVTGAGRGIGLAFTQKLLKGNCNVMIADLALQKDAEELLDKHKDTSSKAVFIKTDVTDWKQLDAAFDKAISTFGRLDIVCPGAGIFEPEAYNFWSLRTGKDTSQTTSHFTTLEINLTHPIRCTQLAIDSFMRQKLGHGVVIHISSVAAQMAAPPLPLYVTSKAAISHFVRTMAFLEPASNIRVAAVAPGQARTPLWSGREDWVKEGSGDVWLSAELIAERMIQVVTEAEYVGGTVLEIGAESVRRVEMLNDPGIDPSKPGLVTSNMEAPMEDLRTMMEENFGK